MTKLEEFNELLTLFINETEPGANSQERMAAMFTVLQQMSAGGELTEEVFTLNKEQLNNLQEEPVTFQVDVADNETIAPVSIQVLHRPGTIPLVVDDNIKVSFGVMATQGFGELAQDVFKSLVTFNEHFGSVIDPDFNQIASFSNGDDLRGRLTIDALVGHKVKEGENIEVWGGSVIEQVLFGTYEVAEVCECDGTKITITEALNLNQPTIPFKIVFIDYQPEEQFLIHKPEMNQTAYNPKKGGTFQATTTGGEITGGSDKTEIQIRVKYAKFKF
jgi:hypothetical protein